MATNSQLQSIYGFSKEEVEDLLLWKGVLNARNDFFHHGKKINLHKDAERYLQLLFLDLLHHQLGYAPVRAALNSKEHLDLRIFEKSSFEMFQIRAFHASTPSSNHSICC